MTAPARMILLVLLLTGALEAAAAIPPGYRRIAEREGVPSAVLYAIALAESGIALNSGKTRPWPWSLNVEGRSFRFRTRIEAWRALTVVLTEGVTRVDIGLMQVNWAYHRAALGDPWRALDPYHNLAVGAGILRAQFQATGDWWQAVGRYHAPNNAGRAARYRKRVMSRYREIGSTDMPG